MAEIDCIDSTAFSPDLLQVIRLAPLAGLQELPRCEKTAKSVQQLLEKEDSLVGSALEAGLWLLGGELERSHQVSQSLPTSEGSYWHAIMHRREGDYWNAKYWYRKTRSHPVPERLATQIQQTARRSPELFGGSLKAKDLTDCQRLSEALVDHVEQAVESRVEWRLPLQMICWWEWQFLFEHCHAQHFNPLL